jgi:hypothetical protein
MAKENLSDRLLDSILLASNSLTTTEKKNLMAYGLSLLDLGRQAGLWLCDNQHHSAMMLFF